MTARIHFVREFGLDPVVAVNLLFDVTTLSLYTEYTSKKRSAAIRHAIMVAFFEFRASFVGLVDVWAMFRECSPIFRRISCQV